MSFVGLRLDGHEELAPFLLLVSAEARHALLQVSVHLPDCRGGNVVSPGPVPEHQGRVNFKFGVPRLAQWAVRQVHGTDGVLLGLLAFLGVERGSASVGEVAVCARCEQREVEAVLHNGTGDVVRVFLVDLIVVVELDPYPDVIRPVSYTHLTLPTIYSV